MSVMKINIWYIINQRRNNICRWFELPQTFPGMLQQMVSAGMPVKVTAARLQKDLSHR